MNNTDQVNYLQNKRDQREVTINHFRKDLILMIECLVEVLGERPYYQIMGIIKNVVANVFIHRYGTKVAASNKLGVNRLTFRRMLSNCND